MNPTGIIESPHSITGRITPPPQVQAEVTSGVPIPGPPGPQGEPGTNGTPVVILSQAEYDALNPPTPETLYVIVG